jgi:hypothetical protein
MAGGRGGEEGGWQGGGWQGKADGRRKPVRVSNQGRRAVGRLVESLMGHLRTCSGSVWRAAAPSAAAPSGAADAIKGGGRVGCWWRRLESRAIAHGIKYTSFQSTPELTCHHWDLLRRLDLRTLLLSYSLSKLSACTALLGDIETRLRSDDNL